MNEEGYEWGQRNNNKYIENIVTTVDSGKDGEVDAKNRREKQDIGKGMVKQTKRQKCQQRQRDLVHNISYARQSGNQSGPVHKVHLVRQEKHKDTTRRDRERERERENERERKEE